MVKLLITSGSIIYDSPERLALRRWKTGPSHFSFSGVWTNVLQSTMELTVNGSDVTGHYLSRVSDEENTSVSAPLVGTVTDDLISFTVNWGTSITTWVGHGVERKDRDPAILTLWHTVVRIDDETYAEQQWKTVLAGADEFALSSRQS